MARPRDNKDVKEQRDARLYRNRIRQKDERYLEEQEEEPEDKWGYFWEPESADDED